jgi:glycosyltransferase involved in cell wall biosynthesis
MKQPITVIVPCKNEEQNLRACLDSVAALADEILVADSGSSDSTMAIAQSYPRTRVIERHYHTSGDFKNWAIPQASHEWILLIDADERGTPALLDEIRLLLSRGSEYDAYWVRRSNHFMGHPLRFGDARTDKVIRLFRRDVSRYQGPSDHGEVRVATGRVGKLKQPLLHYSYWNYDQFFLKYHRYTALQAEQWREAHRDTTYFKLLVRPMWRFFREYILQLGILDGKKGLQLAWLAAFYSFTKQARLWELNHSIPQPLDPLLGDESGDKRRVA